MKTTEIKAGVDKDAKCDICHNSLFSGPVFYDASTARGWGWLCPLCFHNFGRGLGTGVGQEYDSKSLIKVRG